MSAKPGTLSILLWLFIHVAAMGLICAYYAGDGYVLYSDPVLWGKIISGFPEIRISIVTKVITWPDFLLAVSGVIGLVIIKITKEKPQSLIRIIFFTSQPILFIHGLTGILLLIALPWEIDRIDGEWFGERSPLLISAGFWILLSIYFAVDSVMKRTYVRRTHLNSTFQP